jgi:hypothetical protein
MTGERRGGLNESPGLPEQELSEYRRGIRSLRWAAASDSVAELDGSSAGPDG